MHPLPWQLCLTAAAWAGAPEIIRTLVAHGGNLALKNDAGNTTLHSIVLQSSQQPDKDYKQLVRAVWEATGARGRCRRFTMRPRVCCETGRMGWGCLNLHSSSQSRTSRKWHESWVQNASPEKESGAVSGLLRSGSPPAL